MAAARRVDPEALAKTLLDAIDEVTEKRWDAAVARAAALPGQLRPEKVRALTNRLSRELAAVGAATGVAAASPAVGTAATLMATSAELGWFTARSGDLILTIAALHGRPAPTVDERKAWVLAVLIFGSSARQGFTKLANELGAQLTGQPIESPRVAPIDIDRRRLTLRRNGSTTQIPVATLQAVNGVLSRMLLRRYGSRRGAIALGTALPLGVGALVGGGANYIAVRNLARQADAFFAQLPYSSIDATALEVSGSL